ncbi:hypothetical protein PIB30_066399, partial [Stylosanthes scabra]|nr:hypothetical protein [Stylosanthes scabra]
MEYEEHRAAFVSLDPYEVNVHFYVLASTVGLSPKCDIAKVPDIQHPWLPSNEGKP